MKYLLLFIAFYLVLCLYGRNTEGIRLGNPDAYLTLHEFITTKGYPLEEYTIQTSDGYLLSLLRIPHGRNETADGSKKKVILLLHGELGDGKAWFLNPPGQGIGYVLPDAGYDVWILNNRGCDYSQKHIKYSVNDKRYWDFSFDEMGLYDLPPTIDFILGATGQKNLSMVGYSRGNTLALILLSEVPEYNEKVKVFIALAPVSFVGHLRSGLRTLVPFAEGIYVGLNLAGRGEFFPHTQKSRDIAANYCELENTVRGNAEGLCFGLLNFAAGVGRDQLNQTRLPVYAAQYPSSTSTKTLYHWGQLIRSKKFRRYDYGPLNFIHYNQFVPPDFKLHQITAKVALFWSDKDVIMTPEDVALLRRGLTDDVQLRRNPVPYPYEHFDFIFAENTPEIINEPVLKLLEEY